MATKDYTIEPAGDGEFMVVEHSVHSKTSVLAGQPNRSRRGYFPTVDAAQAEYPTAEVINFNRGVDPFFQMPDVPPSDFDPTICGETWHEDDV